MYNRTAPSHISRLAPNQIFVFGSNLACRHGKGAALDAARFGASNNRCHGLDGSVYGIPTKDENMKVLPIDRIRKYVDNFIFDATNYPDMTFLVTQIGCGLAGYSPEQIAPLFVSAIDVDNIYLPESFWKVLMKGQ